jgi:hypothetical protein
MFKNGKLQQEKVGEQKLSQLMKGNRLNFDHNYTYRTVQYHQPSGSVESLDMDLSESETDSCEETEQEEIKPHTDCSLSKMSVLKFFNETLSIMKSLKVFSFGHELHNLFVEDNSSLTSGKSRLELMRPMSVQIDCFIRNIIMTLEENFHSMTLIK